MKHLFSRIAMLLSCTLLCSLSALCAPAPNAGLISVEWTPIEGKWNQDSFTYTYTGDYSREAKIKCTFRSTGPVTFDISSYSRRGAYLMAGNLDKECTTSDFYASTKNETPGAVMSVTYNPADSDEHYVEFYMYSRWSMSQEEYAKITLPIPPTNDFVEENVGYNLLSLKERTAQVGATGEYTGQVVIKDEVLFPFNEALTSSLWEPVEGDWTIVDGKYIGTPSAKGENLKLKCTFRSEGKVYFDVSSINSDMNWNYLMVGKLDTPCTTGNNSFSFSKGSSEEPKMIVFDPQDSEQHWVEFVYVVDTDPEPENHEGATVGLLAPMKMTVTKIGDAAFKDSPELTSVTLPATITVIDRDAFNNCPLLAEVNIPQGLTSLGQYAFKGCTSIKGMTIPDGVELIDQETFAGCTALENISLGAGINNISTQAFSGCTALKEVKFPLSLTSIGDQAFQKCVSLTEVTLPENLLTAYKGCFAECTGLQTLYITSNLTTLGSGFDPAFEGCTSLTTLYIASNVQALPDNAMREIDNLKNIYCAALTPPTLKSASFTSSQKSSATVYVPEESLEAYKEAEIWKDFATFSPYAFVTDIVSQSLQDLFTTGLALYVGDTKALDLHTLPDNAEQQIEYFSSDVAVAEVSPTGTVTAVAPGSATITLRAGAFRKSFSVVVSEKVEPTEIKLNLSQQTLRAGESFTLTAEVSPEDAWTKEVTWSSSDTSVATVDENGLVTALKKGEAVIYAKCLELTAQCELTVDYALTTEIVIDEPESAPTLVVGETISIKAHTLPDTANPEISFKSQNPEVATVDATGLITAVGKGRTTITLASGDVTKTLEVTVNGKEQTITWVQEFTDIKEGAEVKLSATASSGLPVSYTVVTGEAETDGALLKVKGVGEIKVEASQPGDSIYEAAEPVSKTFNAVSGIDMIVSAEAAIRLEGRELTITTDEDYALYSATGLLINQGSGPAKVSLTAGNIYILTINGKTLKLVIR